MCQQVVDQRGHVGDGHIAVASHITADGTAVTFAIGQQIVGQSSHVRDVQLAVVVHVAHFITVAVLKQRNLLDVAPLALGAVDVDSLHLVEEGALGSQVLNGKELLGDTLNQAIVGIDVLGSVEGGSSSVTGINLDQGDVG